MPYEQLIELLGLAALAKALLEVPDEILSWREKYNRLFSEKISRRIRELTVFDWYDPDGSYEDDCRSYVNALTRHASDIAKREAVCRL